MMALEQARQHLETLGLKQAVEALDNTLDAAANMQSTYPEMLAELLGAEVSARRERYLSTSLNRTVTALDTARQFHYDTYSVRWQAGAWHLNNWIVEGR